MWAVVIWRQNLSFFFTWFCLSRVVSPIWAVVIWRQNLSFFFHLVLSLSGSQSYLGCGYLKAEPFFFFTWFCLSWVVMSYLGCCYLKAEPFLFFFTWFCLSWVVSPVWAVVIWRQNLSLFFTWFCLSWVVSPIWAVVIWRQNLSFFLFGSVSLGELLHFRLCVFILWQTNFEYESRHN